MIDALYQQMEWADATTWRAIVAAPGAENDATIRDRMLHVHGVQHAYVFLWRGAEPVIPGSSHFANLEAIREWGREFHRLVKPVLRELDRRSSTSRSRSRGRNASKRIWDARFPA